MWFKGRSNFDSKFWMFGRRSKFDKGKFNQGLLVGNDDVDCPEKTTNWQEFEKDEWTKSRLTVIV